MNRRSFLSKAVPTASADPTRHETVSPFANKTLPQVRQATSGLEPYAGPWGFDQAAHLLRRTTFGLSKAMIQSVLSQTLSQTVEQLLTTPSTPSPPVNVNSLDIDVPIGQSWVTAAKLDSNGYNPNSSRIQSLKSWWTGLMLNQGISLQEKMTLFWHNRLVTETNIVSDARFCYNYTALLRQYALGNVKELLYQVTIDPAMLTYLNGATSTAAHPNENYARELQELFTIGKGPEIAPGNYTYYTEADVQLAAKVLTGWQTDSTLIASKFTASRHDTTTKVFSTAYQNTVILGQSTATRPNEVDALLTMIFNQEETAKNICRAIYRWFVYYVIDESAESAVIAPLASTLRSNNFDIRAVLRQLLNSAHFFDAANVGCMIKSPLDLAVGTCRLFSIAFPTAADVVNQYALWNVIRSQSANMQMDPGDPPNVAGWPEYYQNPQFYELWINSDTLPRRNQMTDTLIGSGYSRNGVKIVIDPIAFAKQVSAPSDPTVLVNEFAQWLFPIPLTDNQKAFLKETLLPGLPDYEWTIEWNTYTADPTNTTKLSAVKTKLAALLKFMMDMPEYQLT